MTKKITGQPCYPPRIKIMLGNTKCARAFGIVSLITQHPLRKIHATPPTPVLLISPFVINDLPSPDGWSALRAQYEIREQSKANWPSRELNL